MVHLRKLRPRTTSERIPSNGPFLHGDALTFPAQFLLAQTKTTSLERRGTMSHVFHPWGSPQRVLGDAREMEPWATIVRESENAEEGETGVVVT